MKRYMTAAGKPKQWKKMLDYDTVQAKPTLPQRSTTQLALAWNKVSRNVPEYVGGALRRFMLAQYPDDAK